MHPIIKKPFIALSRSARSQQLLERAVEKLQGLMGIGAGTSPDSSGELAVIGLLRERAREAERPLCVFDVGANQGQFLSMVIDGTRGVPLALHAFEPGAAAFAILSARYSATPNLTLNRLGLGRARGTMTLYSNEQASGLASLYPRRLDHLGINLTITEDVPIETLDRYCEQHNVRAIDLLKLDAEGHELEILYGASGLFEKNAIRAVTFEFGGCNIDSRTFFRDFYDFFKERGRFDLFRITPSGYLAPQPAYRESYEQFRTTNFLALSVTK